MTADTKSQLEGRRSIDDLLEAFDLMGIPHFQRGSVWDTDAVALLLESLYYGTPCGSIILWAPPSATIAQHGIPLGASAHYLIIDGQQRIRSLHGVFGRAAADSPEASSNASEDAKPDDNEDVDEDDGVWCLNLGRVPEFATTFEGGKRYQLFRRTTDPRNATAAGEQKELRGAPKQDQEALLPLNWYLENEEAALRQLVQQDGNKAVAKAVLAVLANPSVNRGLRKMQSRRLFDVTVLGPERSLQEVIGIFNRINSAGKRVEAEEKAFANLVAAYPDAEEILAAFFKRVFPKPHAQRSGKLRRDDLLQRQKENRFGFKLFMRVFVMMLGYHSNRAIGSASLSFDAANPASLSEAREHLRPILNATVELLAQVAEILRNRLCCDDFRMLPETASLWPLFQLSIRFPQLVSGHQDALAAAALRLIVADLEKQDLLTLSARVREAENVSDALAVFDGQTFKPDGTAKAIRNGVGRAQSLTDRYALIMYWLLRHRGAEDFSYEANVPEHTVELRKKYKTTSEAPLSEFAEPQKQHVVPYKSLKEIFGLTGARPGRHPAHDIGNLTYISAGLNSFDIGVGSEPLKLRKEGEDRLSNLRAHVLDEADLLRLFDAACNGDRAKYEKFCLMRRNKIKELLIEWELNTRNAVAPLRSEDLEMAPTPRLVVPQLADRLRGLQYAPTLTGSLLRIYGRGMKEVAKKDVAISIAYRAHGAGKRQMLRVDLFESGAELTLKLSNPALAKDFDARYPKAELTRKKNSLRCRVQTRDESQVKDAVEKLDWVASQLS